MAKQSKSLSNKIRIPRKLKKKLKLQKAIDDYIKLRVELLTNTLLPSIKPVDMPLHMLTNFKSKNKVSINTENQEYTWNVKAKL